ncbi:Glycosyl transferase family group 2 [Methylocapsa palsarum]|uniref:Glycosyl transferase family group 2 n=1 Tax=Methylocapsa palsarum TaxID=1612308 RepID=A0A1I3Z6Z3_9HYPH|nr:Glycosyl transferase family group 2 [Methylocapsa palsarum]
MREVCGWDAWNVTEDADLGLRLARFGYRTDTLLSNTEEEAPAHLAAWLSQRRRWSKGWMQTFITLSRNPGRLVAEVGAADAGALVLLLTALVVAPPLWPLLAGFMIHDLAVGGLPAPTGLLQLIHSTLWMSVGLFGLFSTVWLAILGMTRRKLLSLWPFLPLLAPYYLLMSVAAWLAVYDLVLRPFHWAKTEHGLARSSRKNSTAISSRAAALKRRSAPSR